MLDVSFLKTNIFSLSNVDAKKVLDSLEEDNTNANGFSNEQPKKRRRLDDFTPQERMVRRKLKNRVAAQNARDRKKERMDQLENIVSRLEVENKELKRSNEELRTSMHYLSEQNKKLREKLGMDNGKVGNVLEELKTEATFPSKVLTPVIRDYDHIVIRKKEESESEHAAETPDTFFFLNHDLVNQPRADKLLDLLGQGQPRESTKNNAYQKVGIKVEQEIWQETEVNTSLASDESSATFSNMSAEEKNELFELCEDIKSLVGESDNVIVDTDILKVSEGTMSEACSGDDVPTNVLNFLDDTDCLDCLSDYMKSGNSLENPVSLLDDFSITTPTDNWDKVFTELFPSLQTV